MIAKILFLSAGVLWFLEILPQIYKTRKRKSVEDLSLIYYILADISIILYVIGAILINNISLAVSSILPGIGTTIMIILILTYRKKGKKND